MPKLHARVGCESREYEVGLSILETKCLGGGYRNMACKRCDKNLGDAMIAQLRQDHGGE
jgi:hypothetical protein